MRNKNPKIIQVIDTTRARQERVEHLEDKIFKVWVRVPPADGKANERVIELLSGFLKKPKTSIQILKGISAKSKLIKIY